ncbi:MAG TPA: hypothetical protein VHN74_19690 [Candidatus Angelobacter sp.]|jgi:hypothetical protein|nr:hypothetical protein [Candidatus Angelobacter sp.]
MRQLLFAGLLIAAGVAGLRAGDDTGSRSSITLRDDAKSDDCSEHLQMYNSEFSAKVRDEETRSLVNQPLTITAERNGGIQVTTWDRPDFSLKLCKQAAASDEATARRALAQVRLEVGTGQVKVVSPERDGDVSVGTVLLVKAPKEAKLEMSVHNGGISLNRFFGSATAHAHNGGISFKSSSGTLVAEAQNGGISIKDCSGDVNANVENGGLSIKLPERWEGKGLQAHTHNGGLVVAVPKNISSGVEIAGSEHTSFICNDDVCTDALRTWDEGGRRLLRFGGPNPVIHASTVNGGVVVKLARGEL